MVRRESRSPQVNDKVRICVDLARLKESILREFHSLPCVDQELALLTGTKVFSNLDANSGFWQIGLSPESSKLNTFTTPFGRFPFNRPPFGINSTPENFQKRISQDLEGMERSPCQMDDILFFAKLFKERDKHLKETLCKLQEANLTINEEKCEFTKAPVEFLGTIVNAEGIQVDHKESLKYNGDGSP